MHVNQLRGTVTMPQIEAQVMHYRLLSLESRPASVEELAELRELAAALPGTISIPDKITVGQAADLRGELLALQQKYLQP